MQLRIQSLTERPDHGKRRAVAIGNFDGVHLGHARLLGACVEAGKKAGFVPSVLTFDPHPASVVSPRGAPPRIQTLRSRRRMLRELGIEDLAELSFDEAISRLTPQAFVEQALIAGLQAGCVVVGQGFRFGAKRAGDVGTLRTVGQGRFETREVETLKDSGERVSSSRLRSALRLGDLVEAQKLLGRAYEIEGLVVQGDGRGRSLGFATANIDLGGVSALKSGVYAAAGHIERDSGWRRAAVNLGVRPSFGGEQTRLEVHFPGWNDDLYGRVVRLVFLARLRDEKRFESLEDLKAQLVRDVAEAENFPGHSAPH